MQQGCGPGCATIMLFVLFVVVTVAAIAGGF
jgi:hypothetical protein